MSLHLVAIDIKGPSSIFECLKVPFVHIGQVLGRNHDYLIN